MAHSPIDTRSDTRSGKHTGKIAAGLFALATTLVAALAAGFVLVQSVFPWMTVLNPASATAPDTRPDVSSVVDVTHADPTPAETALAAVMSIPVPRLAAGGWREITATGGVPGVSFGFGCDPTDGLAPVVAEVRSWVQTTSAGVGVVPGVTASLTISARAYPAGGGAAAFAGLTDAVVACDDASAYPMSGLGVEAVQVVADSATAVVWRRGDVIVVASLDGARSGSWTFSGSLGHDVLDQFDVALEDELDVVCLDVESGVEASLRSPYVDRDNFFGFAKNVRIARERARSAVTAEDRTVNPVVSLTEAPLPLPYVPPVLPSAPYPPVVSGPSALPEVVPTPIAPVAPTNRATGFTDVPRRIKDPAGPGCGWAFTGQVAPRFDAAAAKADFRAAVETAKQSMARSWKAWQTAKLAYYDAHAEYVAAVADYETYAAKVAKISSAWEIVETARAEYAEALAAYNTALTALADWRAARDQAREEYKAAKRECRADAEPDPLPGDSPGTDPSTPDPETDPAPSDPDSGNSDEPVLVCPPVRPAILDEAPPTVPDLPVPAPEAQLPTPVSGASD